MVAVDQVEHFTVQRTVFHGNDPRAENLAAGFHQRGPVGNVKELQQSKATGPFAFPPQQDANRLDGLFNIESFGHGTPLHGSLPARN